MHFFSDEVGSLWTYLPMGCRLCMKGAKLVLFITGKCVSSCFYCPVSEDRKEDVIYANERPILTTDEAILEAERQNALGVGITGGEPLLVPDRVMEFMRAFKKRFGSDFHIHLYTVLTPDISMLSKLAEAGLDEIRFHPIHAPIPAYRRAMQDAASLGMEVGIEVPAHNYLKNDSSGDLLLERVAGLVRETGCFLNINELEFSDSCASNMRELGLKPVSDEVSAVAGSREVALDLLTSLKDHPGGVHFCPSSFKDAVQFRERLRRSADVVARAFDVVSEDGTLLFGFIEGDIGDISHTLLDAGVPEEMFELVDGGVETLWTLAEELSDSYQAWLVERYPTWGGMIVEKSPIHPVKKDL